MHVQKINGLSFSRQSRGRLNVYFKGSFVIQLVDIRPEKVEKLAAQFNLDSKTELQQFAIELNQLFNR